jgi:hypothetical protein
MDQIDPSQLDKIEALIMRRVVELFDARWNRPEPTGTKAKRWAELHTYGWS